MGNAIIALLKIVLVLFSVVFIIGIIQAMRKPPTHRHHTNH
jgi:hypothetical protein